MLKLLVSLVFSLLITNMARADAPPGFMVIADSNSVEEVFASMEATAEIHDKKLAYVVLFKDTQASLVTRNNNAGLNQQLQKTKSMLDLKLFVCEIDLQSLNLKKSDVMSGVSIIPMPNEDNKTTVEQANTRFWKQMVKVCNQ